MHGLDIPFVSIAALIAFAASVVAFPAFILQLWDRRPDYRLIAERTSVVDIARRFATKVDGLAVTYRNAPLPSGFLLVTGTVSNTGKKDIDSAIIRDPLSVSLPPNMEWIEFSVAGDPAIRASSEFQGPTAKLLWDMLRVDETVEFQGICKSDTPVPALQIKEAMRFSARIPNLNLTTSDSELRSSKGIVFGMAAVMLVLGLFGVVLYGWGSLSERQAVGFQDNNGASWAVYDYKKQKFVLEQPTSFSPLAEIKRWVDDERPQISETAIAAKKLRPAIIKSPIGYLNKSDRENMMMACVILIFSLLLAAWGLTIPRSRKVGVSQINPHPSSTPQ